jgi:hypothetical protein
MLNSALFEAAGPGVYETGPLDLDEESRRDREVRVPPIPLELKVSGRSNVAHLRVALARNSAVHQPAVYLAGNT